MCLWRQRGITHQGPELFNIEVVLAILGQYLYAVFNSLAHFLVGICRGLEAPTTDLCEASAEAI